MRGSGRGGDGVVGYIRALRMSDDLRLPLALKVTAEFDHSVVAEDAEANMVSILERGRLAGPRSLVVDRLPRGLSSAVVAVGGGDIAADGLTEVFCTSITRGAKAFTPPERGLVRRFLSAFAPRDSLYGLARRDDSVARMLSIHLRSLARCDREVPSILGFGAGLTPSTDDYVLGMLAYADATGSFFREELRDSIKGPSDLASPVSRSMLACALSGRYPEVALRVMRERSPRSLLDLLGHGSTSGFDLALGILAASAIEEGEGAR